MQASTQKKKEYEGMDFRGAIMKYGLKMAAQLSNQRKVSHVL
jgi:hypothetical protein